MATDSNKPHAGMTRRSRNAEPEAQPRLPVERDESSDSATPDEPHESMKRAHADVESGKVDTGRGALTDAVYDQQKKPADPAATKGGVD